MRKGRTFRPKRNNNITPYFSHIPWFTRRSQLFPMPWRIAHKQIQSLGNKESKINRCCNRIFTLLGCPALQNNVIPYFHNRKWARMSLKKVPRTSETPDGPHGNLVLDHVDPQPHPTSTTSLLLSDVMQLAGYHPLCLSVRLDSCFFLRQLTWHLTYKQLVLVSRRLQLFSLVFFVAALACVFWWLVWSLWWSMMYVIRWEGSDLFVYGQARPKGGFILRLLDEMYITKGHLFVNNWLKIQSKYFFSCIFKIFESWVSFRTHLLSTKGFVTT